MCLRLIRKPVLFLALLLAVLNGCSKFRGIPSHYSLKSFTDAPAYSVAYLEAVYDNDGQQKTEVIAGVERLVFRELVPENRSQFGVVIDYIEASMVIQKAFSLRWDARVYKAIQSHGKLSIEDKASDPFYIILKANRNSLEAFAERTIVYLANGSINLSSVSLMVTGLGPVPFDQFLKVPFISEEILMHETFHCMQVEAMGHDAFYQQIYGSSSMNAVTHNVDLLTDPRRAFFEGFAMASERIAADIAQVDIERVYRDFLVDGKSSLHPQHYAFVKDKVFGKVLPRMRWIRKGLFKPYTTLHDPNHLFRYPRDILNSEGVVANTVYNYLMHSSVLSSFPKLIVTLTRHHPGTLVELFEAIGNEFPEDRLAVSQLFVDQTLAVTRNPDTFSLYRNWRRLDALNQDPRAIVVAEAHYQASRKMEMDMVEYDTALNTLLNKPLRINTKHLGKHYPPFSIDLNQASATVLTMVIKDIVSYYQKLGMPDRVDDFKDDVAAQVNVLIHQRESHSNISALGQLQGLINNDLLKVFEKNLMH